MTRRIPPTGFPSVEAVRTSVRADTDWDVAESEDKLYFYILRAAHGVGRGEPFSEEETALNAWLASRMAGKRLCDYAWRLFAQSCTD